MRRRCYFMLPDIASARTMLDKLLLARIEERHIHFLARDNTLPPDMPEATLFQRTDLAHGMEVGFLIGMISGLLACSLMLVLPLARLETQIIAFIMCGALGAVLGAWMAARSAAAIPNHHLIQYKAAIDNGQVLLMVNIPSGRSGEIKELINRNYPVQMNMAQEDTMMPSGV